MTLTANMTYAQHLRACLPEVRAGDLTGLFAIADRFEEENQNGTISQDIREVCSFPAPSPDECRKAIETMRQQFRYDIGFEDIKVSNNPDEPSSLTLVPIVDNHNVALLGYDHDMLTQEYVPQFYVSKEEDILIGFRMVQWLFVCQRVTQDGIWSVLLSA